MSNVIINILTLALFFAIYYLMYDIIKGQYIKALNEIEESNECPHSVKRWIFFNKEKSSGYFIFYLWPLFIPFLIGISFANEIHGILMRNSENKLATWFLK